VVRFNPNGSLDAGFGAGGKASAEFFAPPLLGAQEFASTVLVQPGGKILVAGSARQGQNGFAPTQGAIARYTANRSLDSGFDAIGTLTTTFDGDDGAGALLVQPDGKIIAAGLSENNSTGHVFIALARYNG
jgi:uncharacterized delta-60 repeat protein